MNNLVNPVLFHEGLKHIPENAVVVEIAPHALLQVLCVIVSVWYHIDMLLQEGIEGLRTRGVLLPPFSSESPPVLLSLSQF